MWIDTAMHDNRQPRPHAADRPSTRLGERSLVPGYVEGGGQPASSECGEGLEFLLLISVRVY